MMTKSDFEDMADLFNINMANESLILDFCDMAKRTNPRFDREVFLTRAMQSHRLYAASTVTRLDSLTKKR